MSKVWVSPATDIVTAAATSEGLNAKKSIPELNSGYQIAILGNVSLWWYDYVFVNIGQYQLTYLLILVLEVPNPDTYRSIFEILL